MTYHLAVCPRPGCNALHGVTTNRRGPARPFRGPFISPLRPAPREGRDSVPGGSLDLREATGTASPDSPESSRSKAAGAVMPGSRRPRRADSLTAGG